MAFPDIRQSIQRLALLHSRRAGTVNGGSVCSSDGAGEFGEDCWESVVGVEVDDRLVVSAAQVKGPLSGHAHPLRRAASTTPSHGRQIRPKACQPVALRVRPRPGMARRRSSQPDQALRRNHADPHSYVDGSHVGRGGLMRRRRVPAPLPGSGFVGFCFPLEVITVAVRW
jgi:hypothetical protein